MVFFLFLSQHKYSEEPTILFRYILFGYSIFLYTFVKNKLIMILSNMFLAIGPGQIAIIAVLVLLMFGGKKIPELMKGLGTGIKEFKKGVKEESKEIEKED